MAVGVATETEALEGKQAELSAEEPHPEFAIVVIVLPFEFHTLESQTDPGVEFLEEPAIGRELGGEVLSRPPDPSVQFQDRLGIEVVVANG